MSNDSEELILTCAAQAQPASAGVREYEAPSNDVEKGVAEILAEFLNIERVGIHDNFILLGGESLLAAQAAWRIQNRFGYEVTLRSILAGTVADIAAEIFAAGNDPQA
jgi:acyl carrier protein